jgi:cystathionine beta-lyase/cystathionine gamma-synthase
MLKAMDEDVLSSSKAEQPDKALIRLSVGIEDADDLEADLLNALEII